MQTSDKSSKQVSYFAKATSSFMETSIILFYINNKRICGNLYKLINNFCDINFFFTLNKDLPTRGHDFKLFKPSENLQLRQKYFSNRAITPWNNLPNYVVTAINLNDFKNKFDNYWTETGYGHNQRP